jgi:hypothetical protein
MTNTIYTQPSRLAFVNYSFKQTAMPPWSLYLGLYSTDPSVEVDVDRVPMGPSQWTVTSTTTDTYATNTYTVSFVDVPNSNINGINLYNGATGTEYLFSKSFASGTVTVSSAQVLTFAVGAIRISFDEV